MNIRTILSKPFPVVWYRFVQLIKIIYDHKSNFWKEIELKISRKVNAGSSDCWKERSELFVSTQENCIQKEYYKNAIGEANAIIDGNISIFDTNYKFNYPLKWNLDWRYGHIWKNNYFRKYSFYEKEKEYDYDVKFPWELSRLSFLIPVARAYSYENKSIYIDFLFDILKDWKTNNPISYSVNWYPMEVSIRVINLIQLREILIESSNNEKCINLLNEILLLHGIFLWRNIEYTDVRGNHYAANLTALLLLGRTYKNFYSEAIIWYKYAIKRIESEFNLQFIEDGVNFEKSVSYHRLVVELYLISFIVLQRSGLKISAGTLERFQKASKFILDYTKPNELTPIIGDNDSASVFNNDNVALNDHTNLLQLASLFFEDGTLNISEEKHYSSYEIFGKKLVGTLKPFVQNTLQSNYYEDGGFVIVKDQQNYFVTDVGEVGMKGRGGHGHNDLFSFELMYDQCDFIVDPGCATYTGNLELKNEMKSSSYHNGLTIDGEEIAPLIGNWGISNTALPYDVKVKSTKEKTIISGKHSGYNRLSDPVILERIFEINKNEFKVHCTDNIICKAPHKIIRNLHFFEGVSIEIRGRSILATNNDAIYQITMDDTAEIRTERFCLSYNYGSKIISNKVVVESSIKGTSSLHFSIEKLDLDE